jgi:hypothetical protein
VQCTTSLSPILHGFAPGLCKLQKGCTRLAAANAKAYQLLAHGWWFSQGTPASCTSKNGCHDLAEILLKMALSTNNYECVLLVGSNIRSILYL